MAMSVLIKNIALKRIVIGIAVIKIAGDTLL